MASRISKLSHVCYDYAKLHCRSWDQVQNLVCWLLSGAICIFHRISEIWLHTYRGEYLSFKWYWYKVCPIPRTASADMCVMWSRVTSCSWGLCVYACIDKCACRGSIKGSYESSERGYLRTEVIFKWRIYMTLLLTREGVCVLSALQQTQLA